MLRVWSAATERLEIAPRPLRTLPAVDGEDLAIQVPASLLITGARPDVQALASRIHDASPRAVRPCVQVAARELPPEPGVLSETCSKLLETVAGGTLLVSDVEEMTLPVQAVFMELLAELQQARAAMPPLRLVTGTSVSLHDRVEAGEFSALLFYRLNVLHLVIPPFDA